MSHLNGESLRFGIVVASFNENITAGLLKGASDTLLGQGVLESNIKVLRVPGAFELPFAARQLALKDTSLNGIIVLGAVIRGGTDHYQFVCEGVTSAIAALNTVLDIPVLFGVLTTDTVAQAVERSSEDDQNKGMEVALAAIEMAHLTASL